MSNELTLLDIETGLIELDNELEACETEEERARVRAAIEAYIRAEVTKVDRIRAYILHCQDMASIAKREVERQTARAAHYDKRADAVKTFCAKVLQEIGKTRVEGELGVIRLQKNGGVLPLDVFDESALPMQYTPMTITYPPDKDAIRKALEKGEDVPGAKLGERGVHLRVE